MYHTGATYRIQFHRGFTFSDLAPAAGYLHRLGVGTIYASPICSAVPGSMHGYDVTDAHTINPEIGTLQQLRLLSAQLHSAGIGWLQDIVPNHMAYDPHNKWLMDVLEQGQASPYAAWFDIDWHHPGFNHKVMLPVLTTTLHEAIGNHHIRAAVAHGRPVLQYNGMAYPASRQSTGADNNDLQQWADRTNTDAALLRQVVEAQHYAFCHWQETGTRINYRRFFTINGMMCLNMQERAAFDVYHNLTLQLAEEQVIDGVRIDHVDGLYDPAQYLHRLRQALGNDRYICVEKILEPGEQLPACWPVQGTTGYDFIAAIGNLFSNNAGTKELEQFYGSITAPADYAAGQLKKKRLVLERYMQGELDNLLRLALSIPGMPGLRPEGMKAAIALLLVYCPVYRYYSNGYPPDEKERGELNDIFERIRNEEPEVPGELAVLQQMLQPGEPDGARAAGIAHFFKRCMQFTGPLMAKGVEDTLLYTYAPYTGRNEVGDSPGETVSHTSDFHAAMAARQRQWPATMNATATHDTKHGEDARTRLHALTHMPGKWAEMVRQWKEVNGHCKQQGCPTANDEYFIYQSLVAAYPMPGQDAGGFGQRFKDYVRKALREGKTNTSWDAPCEPYEAAVMAFVDGLLAPGGTFMQRFLPQHAEIADAGIALSLSQLLLKCTCPGIPDIYQGCELWDMSMVDPDNRRPVDYALREAWLNEVVAHNGTALLWQQRYNGKIKLWLLHKLLAARKADKELFARGAYVPLRTAGKYGNRIVAYARTHKGVWYVAVAAVGPCIPADWEDTHIVLPEGAPAQFRNVTGTEAIDAGRSLQVGGPLRDMPCALLCGTVKENRRGAGLLLPIFSLPGAYGIGDMGGEARRFARILQQCGQKYWQLLPLNPAGAGSMYSPYSSLSAMACNPLLISPELLIKDGLIAPHEVAGCKTANTGKADYEHAEAIKTKLLDSAYGTYCSKRFMNMQYGFEVYCARQQHWLHDFALYMALKRAHAGKPWHEWPDEYKWRDAQALKEFAQAHAADLHQSKWVQYITGRQWMHLRRYCNDRGISIVGDLPFYVSHDSADVWAHTHLFALDEHGAMAGVAGVPPDYFSNDGQLWGVPTYNWIELERGGYKWWTDRLKRNIELFDLVRIDHFRALQSYWEVPAGSPNARNGKWVKGPGMDFFAALQKELPELPLIAEDLGYEMDEVYALREASGLPGMKVLQFAWGGNMSSSVDAPHNYPANCIVYTGTHDNNTTLGWYRKEASEADRRRISEYTGTEVNEGNINETLIRMAYASVAETAILPVQDILRLDEQARTNTPGTTTGNWQWRMSDGMLPQDAVLRLLHLVKLYRRD